MTGSIARMALIAAISLILGGCGVFFDEEQTRIPGERISVLSLERQLEPDRRIADLQVRLPPPVNLRSWPLSGGTASHAPQHIAIPNAVNQVWRTNIGEGSDSTMRLLATPIIVNGLAFVMDVESQISALNVANGEIVWTYDLKVPDDDDEAFGGGLAYADGKLFVSTGFADVIALDIESGKEIWRKRLSGPMRAAPTVDDRRVFVITVDNQIFALNALTGEKLWSHAGIAEVAGLLGAASPAVGGGVVIVPYSSGEIFALKVENGRQLWSDNLSSSRRLDALSTLADIRGMPVIDRGLVFAVSHSGRMVAIDIRTGARAWERSIGGVEMPWIAGEFIYVLTNESQLVCLTRRGGRIRWVLDLPRFEDEDDKDAPIKWSGPVLAGDRLLISGSHGEAWSISPYSGEILGREDLSGSVYLPPVVADGTVFFLIEDGDLVAMR
ncbi:MAG: Outer membrane protein assembly factor BamB [Alphaproteobacteria bacterium MarineAlpha10_Bin3]|nr:MAG: Outer membrane protein assembly factor BamB [Alphaproteobacteria bacterium MarineAlpha10_Bin3]PPR75016.1 MAG: Outer membrane protein assembly factor BamB [Alphaproteobacteria bacterium MarineAlpha4_Bin1]